MSKINLSRRGLLGMFAAGAAAAIINPGVLMPVKPKLVLAPPPMPTSVSRIQQFSDILNATLEAGDQPDMILCSPAVFLAFNNELESISRFGVLSTPRGAVFFRGCEVIPVPTFSEHMAIVEVKERRFGTSWFLKDTA